MKKTLRVHTAPAGKIHCYFVVSQPPLPLFQDVPTETVVVDVTRCSGFTSPEKCRTCDATFKRGVRT